MIVVIDKKEREDFAATKFHKFVNVPPGMRKDVGCLHNLEDGSGHLLRFAKVLVKSYL
jgi:hypothetical protein